MSICEECLKKGYKYCECNNKKDEQFYSLLLELENELDEAIKNSNGIDIDEVFKNDK